MSNSNLASFVNRFNISRVVIYQNLPFGGGLMTYQSVIRYLGDQKSMLINGLKIRPSNILEYLYNATIKNIYHDYIESKKLNSSDLLIAFQNWLSYAPPILLFTKKINSIYICHEPPREYSDQEYIKIKKFKNRIIDFIRIPIKFLDLYIVKKSKSIVVSNSVFSQKQIKKYYGVSSRVIYPGYNEESFFKNSKVKKKYQIICVGSINALKNQEFILKVVSRMQIKKPKVVLVCNGYDSNYLSRIRSLARKLNIEIEIYYSISTNKLTNLYQESLLYLCAPRNEPFGLTVLEAMACGLPIVVYKYGGGYAELVNPSCGEIIENLNIDLWASKIINLLRSKTYRKISNHNARYAKKFTDRLYFYNIVKAARVKHY